MLLHTNDGSDAIVTVPDKYVGDFKYWASYNDVNGVLNSQTWNDNYKKQFGLAPQQLSSDAIEWMKMLNSEWSRTKAVEFFLNPTTANYMAFSGSEALSQWTNPYLVVGAASGVIGGIRINPARQILSRAERLAMFKNNLAETATPKNPTGALKLINQTLDNIEVLHAGAKDRMFGILDNKYVTYHTNGNVTALTKGHRIEIQANGSFKIFERNTGNLFFSK